MLQKTESLPANVPALLRAVEAAERPEEVLEIEAQIAAAESYMRKSGLGIEEARPLIELKMIARWRLGKLLAAFARGTAPGKGKMIASGFQSFLSKLGLTSTTATAAQRIACLSRADLNHALQQASRLGELVTFSELIRLGRPLWAQLQRQVRHAGIRSRAAEAEAELGPFPLIYADPPWKWGHFGERDKENENGKDRTPDSHYPTLTHDEICEFKIQGRRVADVTTRDAALFLWCTSSNVQNALEVMIAWNFSFKSSAVWVKMKDGKLQRGMGLVFRNAHEVLLYGTRGEMPGPQFQPPSVFIYPRAEHSAKPPEIRKAIEKMYPDFDARTRLELFARGEVKGWSGYGYEA